ncbi:MAG TPA: PrsW family glutamic-type intramembrane protease, partial [Leptolinea sp.]
MSSSTIKTHLPSLGMLFLSGGSAFIAVSSAAGLALFGLVDYLAGSTSIGEAQTLFSVSCAASLVFILLLPSTILAGLRLAGRSIPGWHSSLWYRVSNLAFVLIPGMIGFGFIAAQNARLAALILPWIQLAVIGIPLWWLLETGMQGLPSLSSQRGWGIFSFSVTTTMPIVMVVEILILLIIGAAIFIGLRVFSPDSIQQLNLTVQRLANANIDRETIIRILRPYLSQPIIIFGFFAITAGVIPLLEEFLKPLALWFFSSRPLSAREGFMGGLICGASFALLESLLAIAEPAAAVWSFVAIGRVGTCILHTTASGLVGWGLGSAWSERKYLRLAGAYAMAVLFHSLWNISALMAELRQLAQFSPLLIRQFEGYIQAAPIALLILALSMILVIKKANLELRKTSQV